MAQNITRQMILAAATAMIEGDDETDGGELSLRAVARRLGVKAPSLYRYFADKAVLERAVVEETQRLLFDALRFSVARKRQRAALVALAVRYVEFARQRPALYAFAMRGRTRVDMSSGAGGLQWKLMLKTIGALSGNAHDVSAAVALWSFLHGNLAFATVRLSECENWT